MSRPAGADLVVIGGGPAGYAAALRASQLGLETLCIDERERAGGTCLHVGCIPSKALLHSTELLDRTRSGLGPHGIAVGDVEVDLAAMMERKQGVVDTLTTGLDGLLDKAGVARLRGRARLAGGGEVVVTSPEGEEQRLSCERILLATGSTSTGLPDVPVDGRRVVTSTEALSWEEVPEHLAIVGGGYIGLELGSVWRRLGADVTVLELEDRLLPGMDADVCEAIGEALREQGLAVRLRCGVRGARAEDDGVVLRLAPGGGRREEEGEERDGEEELRCSHVLVAVGREPASRELGLEQAGVECGEGGFVRTDRRFRTTAPGVYAVGDLVGEPMLAHKGLLEGLACVEALAGRGSGHVDYEAVPAVVYTAPEVAALGRTEDALRDAGVRYRVGRASFEHDSRALCTGEARGFVKLLAEPGSDRLLGAHLVGPDAGSLVHELVATRELGGCVEELGRAAHAHPTLNETVREAALALHGRAIHR